jgi:glycosyltransferase involved in cell wall biosynthesis
VSDDAPRRPARVEGPPLDAEELRAEVDRLRRVNQELLEQIEDVRSPSRALLWHWRRLWHAAWHQYYVARWKLLHARDPKKGLRPRDEHDPYVARMRHPALPERRRVMHFIGNFHTGGSAQLVVDLVEHLGHRFEQKIVVRSLPPSPAYTGVELVHREWSGPRAMLNELRAFRPDIVHVHMLAHQYDEYGKREWSWYHDVFRAVEAYGAPCVENINIPVEPYLSPAVRCYVHVSDYVRERYGQRDRWNETIYPGSDLDFFDRPADAPIPDDSIGMIYRLQPDKLDERSIEPFIEVAQRRAGTRVAIVGGGQYLDLYKRRVAAAGVADAFTFTGYVPFTELPAHLARLSIFVAPVHTESFGQVSPFAMGMGIPVAGYDVGALREITADPTLLAPAGGASALADILISLLDDRERRLRIGEHNRLRARALFSVEAMVARYESLYEDLLTSPRKPKTTRATVPAEGGYRARAGGAAPAVSVVMAVHNGERFLREAVESVLDQTFGSFELLVVDDASTDRTRAILDTYRDRRIRVIANDRQRGLSYSLNRGIGEARGRYIARLDADDVAEPDRFATQVEYLDRHADVALLGSWYSIIDEQGRETGRRWVPGDHHEIRWMLGFCNAFAHSAVMIRRTALDEVGLYDESLRYAMDYDLWVRIAERMRVANYEKFLLRWRTSSSSLTSALGDRTELLDRVVADLGRRLDWSGSSAEERERRAGLLIGIIAGSPDDMSIDDARWAVDTLFTLHRGYCAEHARPGFPEEALWQNLRRNVARALLWMGHRYPDRRDARYARSALALAAKVDRKALASREAAALVAKLLGGRPAIWVSRSLAPRVGRG